MGDLKIAIEGDNIQLWSIPLKSKICAFTDSDDFCDVPVGGDITVANRETFEIRVSFEKHLLVITGRHAGNKWPIVLEWFDFSDFE